MTAGQAAREPAAYPAWSLDASTPAGNIRCAPPHARHYRRAGKPGLDAWLAAGPAMPLDPLVTCQVPDCGLRAGPEAMFCYAHAAAWAWRGRPDPAQSAAKLRR